MCFEIYQMSRSSLHCQWGAAFCYKITHWTRCWYSKLRTSLSTVHDLAATTSTSNHRIYCTARRLVYDYRNLKLSRSRHNVHAAKRPSDLMLPRPCQIYGWRKMTASPSPMNLCFYLIMKTTNAGLSLIVGQKNVYKSGTAL